MPNLTKEELSNLHLCDAQLIGVSWVNSGVDLQIELLQADSKDGSTSKLNCSFATKVRLNLDFAECSGFALSWEAKFEELPNGRWTLDFSFPPTGTIALECNAVRLDPTT